LNSAPRIGLAGSHEIVAFPHDSTGWDMAGDPRLTPMANATAPIAPRITAIRTSM
jgi:hypothetical protein